MMLPQYNLDWSTGKVTQDDLDYSLVDTKIEMFNSCTDQHTLGLYLQDETIYAYAMLKWNGQPVKLRPYQDAIINDTHRQIDVEGANQCGKEQPLSAKILTPSGWTTMRQIQPGDSIIGQDGLPHKVLKTFPQGVKQVYRLTFDDGSIAECGLNHLWKFIHPKNRFKRYSKDGTKYEPTNYGKYQVSTLKDIIDIAGCNPNPGQRIVIPVCEPVVFPERTHVIAPYLLGSLLGDGMFRHWVGFTCCPFDAKEIIPKLESLLPKGQYFKKTTTYDYRISSKGYCNNKIKDELKKLNLWGLDSLSKFVPNEYLFDSVQNRIELLRGLMDTDGTIDNKGRAEFYSISYDLARGVQEIVQSLGGKAEIKKKPSWYKDSDGKRIDCNVCYRVKIKLQNTNPFYLKRKADRHYKIRYRKERVLRKIELVRQEESKCILVDSDDHTYITDNYVVTHNSFTLCVKALVSFLQDHGKNWTIVLVSRSQAQNGINMRMIKQILKESKVEYTPGEQDSMTVMTHKIDGTDYVNTLICAIAGGGGLGYAADLLLLDEFEFWEEVEGKTLEWYYDQIFLQRTNETKGQIMIYSNPNGKNFVSENLQARKTKTGEYVVHTYNFNFLANPANTREEWDERKSYMHPIMFASTMAAQRTESEGAALTDKDIDKTKDAELDDMGMAVLADKPTYWALDLGFVYDQSALVAGFTGTNDKGETVYYFVPKVYPQSYPIPALWGKEDGSEESVPSFVKKHDWQRFELDLTGKEGNEVLANDAGLSCYGIKMSGQWKATWYERFITLCKQGRIKVLQIQNYLDGHNKNFEYQARTLRIQTKMANGNNRPYPLYHHQNEKDHDDILDACVMCLSLMDDDMTPTPSSAFIEYKRKKTEEDNVQEENMYAEAARLNGRVRRQNMYW